MQYTKNYEFKKPESDDFYNVEDFNENVEKIDKELKSNAEKIDTVSTSVDDIANAVGTEKLQTTAQSIIPAINEISSVAKGKNRARVFATTDAMNAWLSNAANAGVANVGDNLYIVDVGVPDWWIAEILAEPNESGYYYEIGQLETQKVDLTTYDERIQKNADNISALNSDLANKASSDHIHAISEITGLQTTLNSLTSRGGYSYLAGMYDETDEAIKSVVCTTIGNYRYLVFVLQYVDVRIDVKTIPRAFFVNEVTKQAWALLLKSGNSEAAALVWWDSNSNSIFSFINSAYNVVNVYGIV